MKKLRLLILTAALILVSGITAIAQNEKCLTYSKNIINNTKAKIQREAVDFNGIYYIKAEISSSYDLNALKTICDTTIKTTKVAFNWRLNDDKNYEKEYLINGNKLLVTIYFNDKFLYFEFPND